MKQTIDIYSVAGNRRGEGDQVGGVAKMAMCQEIASNIYFLNAEEVVTFLTEKFGNKDFPKYVISKIKSDKLDMYGKKILPIKPSD